jgi:ABC-2 type transport system ATP-binding protein
MSEPAVLTEDQPQSILAGDSPAIHSVGLARQYGSATALEGLSMTVPRGEIFGFLGPNGAGKTTAVKLLLGLATPSSGEAWVLGQRIGSRAARRRVGYLPELFRYPPWLSGREVLGVHCELMKLPRPSWGAEIEHALKLAGLSQRGQDRVRTYSKGMQQRLGLGVALLGSPELVILDEPVSALDPGGRHDVRDLIRGLKQRGATVFLNSHLLTEVELVCDRVAVIDRGRLIAIGTPDELLGGDSCRLRVTGLTLAQRSSLETFGRLDSDSGWLTVTGIEADRVPDLVAEVVRLGGRVYEVEVGQETLEEGFLRLLRERAR